MRFLNIIVIEHDIGLTVHVSRLLAIVLGVALSGPGAGTIAQAAEVIQVPARVAEGSPWSQMIHWLDNDRVTFVGYLGNERDRSHRLEFTLATRQIIDKGPVVTICYDGGFMRYTVYSPETENLPIGSRRADAFYGPYGREVKRPPKQRPSNFYPLQTWNCLYEDDVEPPPAWLQAKAKERGGRITRLRPGHGFVESVKLPERFRAYQPRRLYRPTDAPEGGVALDSITAVEIDPLWPYVPFKNAYWIRQDVRVTPMVEGTFRSWWLYPDGAVESALVYDASTAYRGTRRMRHRFIVPYRDGFLVIKERMFNPGLIGDQEGGLYRFDPNGNHQQLARGDIHVYMAVSPDGCRVAFGNDTGIVSESRAPPFDTPAYTLQIINLCTDR